MKKILSGFFMVFALAAVTHAAEWNIDNDHTNAFFSVKHMMIADVQGMFSDVTGVVSLDEKDITKSSVSAVIDVSSLNTGVAVRDNHLKSADFFDLAKYQKMTFVSKRVSVNKDKSLSVTGDLTIHGVTKETVLWVDLSKAIKDPWGNTRLGGRAETIINRKDFGIVWNGLLENGSVLVGDEVRIVIDLELILKK